MSEIKKADNLQQLHSGRKTAKALPAAYERFFNLNPDSPEIDWKTVHAFHGGLSGIATNLGVVRSLLCNQNKAGEYADEVFPDRILYRVTPQTQSRPVAALKAAVGAKQLIRVFEKLGVNRWKDLADWVVVQAEPEGDGWIFLLRRASQGSD